MNLLLKLIATFVVIFLTIFLFIKLLGLFTLEEIKVWFEHLKYQPSYIVGALVSSLLFVDLFLSIPTMATVLLSGYFLGFFMGAFYAFLGLAMASFTGYFLSLKYGEKGLLLMSKDSQEREEMRTVFEQHGASMIILSRAVPMLPEISSALAGVTKMPFHKFFTAWLLSSLPYVLVLSYIGSVSEVENPLPALFAVGGFTLLLWGAWFVKMK
jgi:uncharacterized membrane protein YdjX (TVP38/TMEM64 family)